MSLNYLRTLFDTRQPIVALEAQITERKRVLQILSQLAKQRNLPLYFWNIGYLKLQQVNNFSNLKNSDITCKSGLEWLFNNLTVAGIFAFEGVISSTGIINPETKTILSNLAHCLPISNVPIFLVCIENYVELPSDLLPLIPVVYDPLPSISEVEKFITSKSNFISRLKANPQLLKPFVRASLGLHLGELDILFSRLLGLSHNLEELINGVLAYKKGKLKNQGVEFLSEPDVPQAAGLDLLEDILERAAVLLKPEAKQHNLSFPKGMILWGPPGTGKSLSAKLAASKMGVPMIAADWAGLRGATAYESRKNLREFLQFCDANGEHSLVLYFDDFDKGFAGFDADNDGGVSRQLAGKLLTWMQERTSQVLVMATVNRLEFLPPELIRRFDEIIFVDLPHAGARYEIFKLHLAKYFPGLDFTEKDWLRLLRETKLLTPAEIAMMVRKTAENAFYRNTQDYSGERLGEKALIVTIRDFLEVRSQFTPSMIREEDKIIEIRNKAVYARPASSTDTSCWAKEPEVLFGSSN